MGDEFIFRFSSYNEFRGILNVFAFIFKLPILAFLSFTAFFESIAQTALFQIRKEPPVPGLLW